METENDIDQLFRRGLDDPEIPFNELDWEKMEHKLDEHAKRRVLPFWLFSATGVAAVLALFLFLLFLTPAKKAPELTQIALKKGSTTIEQQSSSLTVKVDQQADGFTRTSGKSLQVAAQVFTSHLEVSEFQHLLLAPRLVNDGPGVTLIPTLIPPKQYRAQTETELLEQKAIALANSKDPFGQISVAEIAGSVQHNMDKALTAQPSLILSAMAAPDITSAASSKPAKISSNLGMLATYALGSRFSVTSGAIYAKKYYNSGGTVPDGTYATGSNVAWEVKADCNVLDIPLNVNYKLLQKKRLSLSVNSGLSSYIMLKEKYEYITQQPGNVQAVSTLELNNQNKHLFGVANVSVSVDHKISENLSVGLQPFVKLPLTGIGNGNVNLHSTGVSFSLNIGLFPVKKTGKLAANRYSSLR